jgi:hypothetical protein
MIKEIIRVEIADAATECFTRKIRFNSGTVMVSLNIIMNI